METQQIETKLDITYIRNQFPSLASGYTYFDNAGGSQTLKGVVDKIGEFLLTSDVQLGASYKISQLAGQRVDKATNAVATLLNAADSKEIVMGSSTTMLIRLLSISYGSTLIEGDEIIVTNSDHEANVSPWMDLQKQGINVKIWKLNPETLQLDLDDLDELMTDRTKLVALCHTSNILGTINPIKEIAEFVHQKNALICVDGVAYAPHRLVDVQDLGVDFYIFSFYKVFGPHHAVMYGKKELLLKIPGVNHYFVEEDDLPYKLQPGNVNYELSYGMLGMTDYLENLAQHHGVGEEASLRNKMEYAFDLFAEQEEILSERLLSFLRSKSNVRIIGEENADRSLRVSTISFVVEGKKSDAISLEVDKHNIGIRYGDFYAKKIIEDHGLVSNNGVVRVSMVHYNTLEEVDKLITVFDQLF